MLKIHSFLQRVKKPISKLIPANFGKYKTSMVAIAYAMVTVLFLLSPDYIYGTGNDGATSYARAEITHNTSAELGEGTANEAIVRINQNNLEKQFILFNFTAKDPLMAFNGLDAGHLFQEGRLESNIEQADAAANEQVDSSSTKEENEQEAVSTVNNTVKDTLDTDNATIKSKDSEPKDAKKTAKSTTAKDTKSKKVNLKTTKSKEANLKTTKLKETKLKTGTSVKDTKNTKKSDKEKTDKYVIKLSDGDVEILERIVEAEATGEDIKGKMLVANVILNRVKDGEFPDSIKGVVFQKDGGTYQFSPIKDNRYWSVKISKDTVKAVDRVRKGEDYSKGALYFSARSRADKNSMRWFDSHLDYLFRYGGHEFFK
ncbi:cell wall hydrolase [Anaerocolumna sp. MB42-C2]|uniref:cell wall hydrolase n=1 Tax=Anaerocolumna sp. MB42-C2 TaxID=3070997 RepID=UPI0027E1F791|nr:cell wall hydrolase [Anaerocolumna sp. MB42-C2]WMJ89821.1 cell wall hydrolase [Anaerocolumna sp. MB42-C2]